MGSEGNASGGSAPPIVHKFGDEELSDVTFIVGGEEFKCHKMFLATRSSYFKAMFCSGFKEKNDCIVPIQADPVAFNRLMEAIYTGLFSSWRELDCQVDRCFLCTGLAQNNYNIHSYCPVGSNLWNNVTVLMQLADLFDVRSYTVAVLETYLISAKSCKCSCCSLSGAKMLIALTYDMNKYKAKNTVTKRLLSQVIFKIITRHLHLQEQIFTGF